MKKQDDTIPKSRPSSKVAFPLNPYTAGPAVTDPKGFFGREEVFRDVMHMLRNPQDNAIVLYGQRRIGKTSVLLQLKLRLAEEGKFTPVYFDLQDKAAKPLGEVLCQLAHEIALVTGQSKPDPSKFDDSGDYFRQTFLPEAAKKTAKGGLVLLFDEFDVLEHHQGTLENQAGQKFFPYLQAWMSEMQRVKFYFVIGRRPEDLSRDVISFLKGVRASRISLLDRKDSDAVIRQSEPEASLFWTDAAIEKVWTWTQGHTYLTQLLCSVIWDRCYDTEPATTPTVEAINVDTAIDSALKQGQNAFHWIWEGLPPAERVIMAAMAETDDAIITQEKLIEILNNSGVRLILRELELAPETLVEWGLLKQADKKGYCFVVPLLRRWVASNRPLRRVKDELDRVDERAEMLFQTAQSFYRIGNLDDAEGQLIKALESNPNHLKAMLLLGNLLFESDRISQAVDIFELAYKWDQPASRAYLIKTLLVLADRQTTHPEQLAIYDRVLGVDPNQRIAQEGRQKIWVTRGESFLKEGEWDQAIAAFQEAGDKGKIKQAQESKRHHKFKSLLSAAEENEKNKDWQEAIKLWGVLISDFSDQGDFAPRLDMARKQASLEQCYNEGITAVKQGNHAIAIGSFKTVISQQPDYKEALRYLLVSLYNVDINKFKPYRKVIKKLIPTWESKKEKVSNFLEKEKEKIHTEPDIQSEVDTKKDYDIKIQAPPFIRFIKKIKQKTSFLWQQLTNSERWKNFIRPVEWRNFISIIQLKKLFKYPFNWLISSLVWLPLLIWSFWYWRSSTVELAANTNFWLLIFFFAAWLITALSGHLGKFQIKEQSFNFQGQAIKIPEKVTLFSVPALVAIISIIIAWGMPLLLLVVLLGVVVAMIIAWKRAGAVALIIGVMVALGVAISIRSTMDTNARKFGLTPYIKSRNAVAQVFIKNALASSEISELATLSDRLHSSLLGDRNTEASDYALSLSDCDSLNRLFADDRAPKILDNDIFVKTTQHLSNNDYHISLSMATFLNKIPNSNLLKLIYQTYDTTKIIRTKQLCLFVLNGVASYQDVGTVSDIRKFVESRPELTEIADARAAILSNLPDTLVTKKSELSSPEDTPSTIPIIPDTISQQPSPILSMKILSEKLSRYLYRQGRTDSVFKYTSLLIARNDSLIYLRTLPWYPRVYNDKLFSKLVPSIENDREGEIAIKFLCSLGEKKALSSVYQKYQATNKPNIKVRYLRIVEYFANNADTRTKDEIKRWLAEKIQRFTGETVVDEILKRIAQVVGIELKQSLPSVETISDSLKDAVNKRQMDKIGHYSRIIIGDDYANDFSKLRNPNIFDINFFKNAVIILQGETGETGNILAEFLRKLGDLRVLDPIYYEFLKIEKPTPKLQYLKIIDAFRGSNKHNEIKTWLGVTRYFEPSAQIDAAILAEYKKFVPRIAPSKGEAVIWIKNLKQSVLKSSNRSAIGIADSALGLVDADTLPKIKADDLFAKRLLSKENFYEDALKLLKSENKYISRSMALFLSSLHKNNESLRQETEKFWRKNSDIELRRLCLIIFAGVAQNSDQTVDVINWLENNLSQEPAEAIKKIHQIIASGKN